jgi:hypothetical protein
VTKKFYSRDQDSSETNTKVQDVYHAREIGTKAFGYSKSKADRSKLVCHRCDKTGHFKKTCFVNSDKMQNSSNQSAHMAYKSRSSEMDQNDCSDQDDSGDQDDSSDQDDPRYQDDLENQYDTDQVAYLAIGVDQSHENLCGTLELISGKN